MNLQHENLHAYRAAIDFLAVSFRVLEALPPGYAFMADQLRRASMSIPLNIAEGNGRPSRKDRAHLFTVARGSATECGAILDACNAMQIVRPADYDAGKALLVRIVAMLYRMGSMNEARNANTR